MTQDNLPSDAAVFETIARERHSIRGFKSDIVPPDLLERIFAVANTAPSNCNTQPWVVHVASGAALAKLRQGFMDALMMGNFSMDFPYDGKYAGVYKERQNDAASRLYTAMGIAREDKVARNDAFMRNFCFFDAPYAAFLFMEEGFGLREAADVGMYAQTLMLALTAFGLGSCPQTALGFHANCVREVLGIEPQYRLLFGISFGYEDAAHPSNQCRTARAMVTDNTTFHS